MAFSILEIVVVHRHGRICLRVDDKVRPLTLAVGTCLMLAPGAGLTWLATGLARSQNATYFVPIAIAVIWTMTVATMYIWYLLKIRRFRTFESFLEIDEHSGRIEQCVAARLIGSRANGFHLTGTGRKVLVGRNEYGFKAILAVDCDREPSLPVPILEIEYGHLEHRRLTRFAQMIEHEMRIPCHNEVSPKSGKTGGEPIL